MTSFAACLPIPTHSLPGCALATGIRNALVASSFRAHMARELKPQPAPAPKRPAAVRRNWRGQQTLASARHKLTKERIREAAGRAQREAEAVPVMTGEELVEAVLVELGLIQTRERESWEKAERLDLPWKNVDGKPMAYWSDVADLLGIAGGTVGASSALLRLTALAGLELDRWAPAVKRGKMPPVLLTLEELELVIAQERGVRSRQIRQTMRGPASRL